MKPPSTDALFPARISRSLAFALAVVIVVVALVGGTSLALATWIVRNNEAVVAEYGHILDLDQVHKLFDDLTLELHQVDSTSVAGRTRQALEVHQDLARRIDVLAELHARELDVGAREREQVLIHDLHRLGEEARALTERMALSGRFTDADVAWLDRASQQVPRLVDELAALHWSRIARRIESSQRLLEAIRALYLVFMIGSAGLLAVASVVGARSIAAPLRELADTALRIAEGRFDARVRVRFRNEIGQLSHAFNVMADRLQAHERALKGAREELEQKVRETQALYRIGTEISRVQQPDRILQSVMDKARELLRGDAVALCLFTPGRERFVARVTSGPPEAFRSDATPVSCEPVPTAGGAPPCPIIRPEYARAHLAAPILLGDEDMGAIWVASRDERQFTPAEAELLAGLATQTAIAIERARLGDEVRSLAAAEERGRIAREMHDGLAQALGLLHLKLQSAGACAADPDAMRQALDEMVRITAHAYEDVRQSIFGLHTFVSRGLGLVPTLTEYLHEFSVQNQIAVELEVADGLSGQLPPASEVQAVRIIQEALTNVRKHSAAAHARVRLQGDGDWMRLSIEDDGVGWDSCRDPLHFGLQMMRERAEGLGGRLEVDTAPGRGTRVVATLPRGGA